MEALFTSTAVVALAEIGDKTQLLAIVLATRFQRSLPIILGIFVATLANHFLAALLGAGPVADAFLAAFQVVNVVRRLLTEGGLNATLRGAMQGAKTEMTRGLTGFHTRLGLGEAQGPKA